MPSYMVTVETTNRYEVEVVADSKAEAEKIGHEICSGDKRAEYYNDSDSVIEVEELSSDE